MSLAEATPLIVGEIYVDFTVTERGEENKLRLGGVAHAARGFWALDVPFSAAVILPEYMEDQAHNYFSALGCNDFHVIGRVRGAPNVTVIFDATEVADQEYDTLLRDEKLVELSLPNLQEAPHKHILIFPGNYNLAAVCAMLPPDSVLHIDAAYDVADPRELANLTQKIRTVFTSTSSPLYLSTDNADFNTAFQQFALWAPETFILKENRGGSRMRKGHCSQIERLPAQLGHTVNSVGVGDVFAAAYVAHNNRGEVEAAWRATYAAAAYSQTTFPDLFKTYVQRDMSLTIDDMIGLWGTFLPWEKRRQFPVYFAAPDFQHTDRHAVDKAIASLLYHNFQLRRPVLENGELPPAADLGVLQRTYRKDYDLLKRCRLVFAVPTGRDPGTLVEIGIAIEAGIPVVVYDPDGENANTMVMAGAQIYSQNLDSCLNGVFQILSEGDKQ